MIKLAIQKFSSLSKQRQGVLALILLTWVFATMGLFARKLDTSFELFEQTYLRISLALLLGIVLFFPKLRFKNIFSLCKKDFAILIFRAITLYTAVVLITEAFLNTKFSTATIVSVLPLMPILGFIILRERIKFKTVIWIIVGFIGVVLVALKSFDTFSFGYGELLAFISLLLFDLSYITRKWQSDKLNNYESTVVMFALAIPFLITTSFILNEGLPQVSDFSVSMIGILIVAALFNVVNLFLTNFGFEHVKAAVAGNILTLEIFFALVYGFSLYGEVPILREIIGGALIIMSVFSVNSIENGKN